MAQKKKVSVKSVASKKAKEVKKTAEVRTKATVTKKAATKTPVKSKTTATKSTSKAAAKAVAAKAKTTAKKPAATAARKAPAKTAKRTAAKALAKAAAKKTAPKTATSAKSAAKSASKSPASTRAKIAAAAKKVAAQKTASAPSKTARMTKAVAAAGPSTAKRSSEPVSAAPAAAEAKRPAGARHGFKLHEYVVYPAHGVGQIVAIEEQEIAGMSLELFVITFEKDKMTLRVPTSKVDSMRKLAEDNIVDKAMTTLKGRARVKRTMWSRRAQEYENKINSGDLIAISEVVRDLYRSESQPEQSYSERQLYEAALDRMARELAAVEKIDERQATQRIIDVLSKSAKGRRLAEEEKAANEAANNGDAEAA